MSGPVQAYVDAFEQSVRSLLGVLTTLDDEQWRRPTECPGWTVKDQVGHIVALERQFLGEAPPPSSPSYAPHVRNDMGRHMEDGVLSMRGTAPDKLVLALRETLDRRLAGLRDSGLDPAGSTPGVLGNAVPVMRFWPVRVLDVWAHEQDVRRAVGAAGNLSGPAADVARDQIAGTLPYVVGKLVAPPSGSVIVFDVSGATELRISITVGDDGRAAARPGIAETATTVIRTDWETFTRLACGRIEPATAAFAIEGDLTLGRDVLAKLAITP